MSTKNPSSTDPDLIVGVTRCETGFVVTDHERRLHTARDTAELGRIIAELLNDPSLPHINRVPLTGAMRVRNGAVEIVSGVLPAQLQPAAGPLVDVLGKAATALREWRAKPKPRAPAPAGSRRVPARTRTP